MGIGTSYCCRNYRLTVLVWQPREIDRELVDLSPNDIDPNGENGEYQTFCYDSPIFRYSIPFRLGRLSLEVTTFVSKTDR